MTKTGRTRSVREDPAALLDSYLTMVAHQPSSTPTRKENR
jgi:hypothetical protein